MPFNAADIIESSWDTINIIITINTEDEASLLAAKKFKIKSLRTNKVIEKTIVPKIEIKMAVLNIIPIDSAEFFLKFFANS